MTIDELARLMHALYQEFAAAEQMPPTLGFDQIPDRRQRCYKFVAAHILDRLQPEEEAKP
jgi:hypothetical protein